MAPVGCGWTCSTRSVLMNTRWRTPRRGLPRRAAGGCATSSTCCRMATCNYGGRAYDDRRCWGVGDGAGGAVRFVATRPAYSQATSATTAPPALVLVLVLVDLSAPAQVALTGLGLLALAWAHSRRRRPDSPAQQSTRGRPGWLARRRAGRGISHGHDRVGVGYERAVFGTVHLTLAELNHHGYLGGATGSGKTTLVRGLLQGFPGPVIALDCKGDQDLAETVWSLPGLVWEIGGPLQLDLLDPEPAILAQQLLEGEAFGDRGAVYRAIAEHAVIRAGQVLRWRSEPLELGRILELVSSPTTLAEAIREAMPADDRMAQRWLAELDEASATIREGFQTFVERLGSLLDSPAGRSLGTGPEAVRLADVLASGSKLLIRLDPRYGAISRKAGAWTLVAMLRLAAELRQADWHGRCLFIVDDPRLLKREGRWLADLFGTARDAGIGLVVADQGIAGLAEVHPDLPDAVLRSTGWQLIFRQCSPDDAEKMAALFGTTWREDTSYSSDGRTTTRLREEPR